MRLFQAVEKIGKPMIRDKKVVVVMPAYKAAKTLETTYREIPFDIVDEVILVDDASPDDTIAEAKRLGIKHIVSHPKNRGYGGNQKSCYNKALESGLFRAWSLNNGPSQFSAFTTEAKFTAGYAA